jgi:hypothetical protein
MRRSWGMSGSMGFGIEGVENRLGFESDGGMKDDGI